MKDRREERFLESLAFGKQVEAYVLSRIIKKYPKAFIRDGNFKGWDIYVPEKKIKIEVKSDVRSNRTGNIVIETSYGGRSSALTTSTADLWVFFTGNELIWITPDQIKRAVRESCVDLKEFRGGIDRECKTAFLVPASYIRANATRIDKPLNDLPENFNFKSIK